MTAVVGYRTVNQAVWDERAAVHVEMPVYEVKQLLSDPEALTQEVKFDLRWLDNVDGLDGLHLQCHIGTDTISLARLGAHMTGLDFSGRSIAEARKIAVAAGTDIDFVVGDLYDAVEALDGRQFEFIFTGIGALCWLPDVEHWGRVVSRLLKPGGWFFIREAHPMLWAVGDVPRPDGALVLEKAYFEQRDRPVIRDDSPTCTQTAVALEHRTTLEWNHGLGEIITALIDAGLCITSFREHDSVPWEALPGHMNMLDNGEWRLRDRPERLPHSYTLRAEKPKSSGRRGSSGYEVTDSDSCTSPHTPRSR
jgi:SAM-dependent methyltransferase